MRDEFRAWEAQIALCSDIYALIAMKEPIERCQALSGVETWDLLRQLDRRRSEVLHIEVVEVDSKSRELGFTFESHGVKVIGDLPEWLRLS